MARIDMRWLLGGSRRFAATRRTGDDKAVMVLDTDPAFNPFKGLAMFKPSATALFVLAAFAAQAQTPSQTPALPGADCPTLEVSGLQPNAGTVQLAVYGSADQYFKKPVFVTKLEAKGDSMRVAVCGVTASEIAVTGFQDLNGNDKMDFNALGIPTEPYGASGKPPRFSSPTWETTKVVWPPANGAAVLVKF